MTPAPAQLSSRTLVAILARTTGRHTRRALQGRDHSNSQRRRVWRGPLAQVALNQPSPNGQRAILAARAPHHIAPAKVGHRTPVGHRACKELVDARMLVLPHAQESRTHPQVMARLFQQRRVQSTPR